MINQSHAFTAQPTHEVCGDNIINYLRNTVIANPYLHPNMDCSEVAERVSRSLNNANIPNEIITFVPVNPYNYLEIQKFNTFPVPTGKGYENYYYHTVVKAYNLVCDIYLPNQIMDYSEYLEMLLRLNEKTGTDTHIISIQGFFE